MGLNIYLYAVNKKEEEIDCDNVQIYELAYLRKANQIRNLFIQNLNFEYNEYCGHYKVTKEQLINLKEDCLTILNNHELAQEIMPISTGFFFGSSEYNEYYFDQLDMTVDIIDDILNKIDFNIFNVYYTEWY